MAVMLSDPCDLQFLQVSYACVSNLFQDKQQLLLPGSWLTLCYYHTCSKASQLDDSEHVVTFQVAYVVQCRATQQYHWPAHSNVKACKLMSKVSHTGVLGHGCGAF